MHAFDRTILAKLGFSDPDKQDCRHDLACQYLSQPANIEKIIKLLNLRRGPAPFRYAQRTEETIEIVSQDVTSYSFGWERPIEKGTGQYKTTIGFIDVVLSFEVIAYSERIRTRRRVDEKADWSEWKKLRDTTWPKRINVGVEVKIAPVQIGHVLRQINLYRSYCDHESMYGIHHWILATACPISNIEAEALHNERIRHVRLGQGFDQFMDMHQAAGQEASGTEI